MNGDRCGRCKGRGWVQPIRGVGQVDCPTCRGSGIKHRRNSLGSHSVSVPLNGARCAVCGDPAVHHHHVISQQRIDRFVPAEKAREAKHDHRNLTPLCFACHDRVESATLYLEAHELHPEFALFIIEYDLEAALPRYMACGAAAYPPGLGERLGTVVDRSVQPPREEAA